MFQVNSSVTEVDLDDHVDGTEKNPVPPALHLQMAGKKQKCLLHAYVVQVERQGYANSRSLPSKWVEESLPGWIKAMPKCGKCSTCKRLWNYPYRSRLTHFLACHEANVVLISFMDVGDEVSRSKAAQEPEEQC